MHLPPLRLFALTLAVIIVGACASAPRGSVRTYEGTTDPLADACRTGATDGDLIAALISADEPAYIFPVTAPVSSPFGMRWGRMHSGVDLDADYGDDIHAARGGIVDFVGRRGGYGRLVEIAHSDGATTRYAHLSAFADGLAEGQRVNAGDFIGNVGASGRAFGAHLHFEIRLAGEAVDPMPYLTEPAGLCREIWVSARPE